MPSLPAKSLASLLASLRLHPLARSRAVFLFLDFFSMQVSQRSKKNNNKRFEASTKRLQHQRALKRRIRRRVEDRRD